MYLILTLLSTITSTEDTVEFTATDSQAMSTSATDPDQPWTEEEKKAPPRDPIRWFGILVPPSLREAQSTFRQGVDDPIPKLAGLSREMRIVETEVARLRKAVKKL